MRCLKCGTDNRESRKFCADCGAALIAACPRCGASNQPHEKFCGECGTALGEAAPAAAADTAALTAFAGGERRHLTVLFCDLVGSTEIAARLDPEEWRDTVAGYHRTAAEAIRRFDGHVAKYLGDGVMAYFGWPAAHDNDAERAARAGLAILDAVAKLNEQPGHAHLSARVGIDSGLVVIGEGAGNEAEVFGDTPNIAARVQAAAEAGTVAITDASHRLVSGLFVVEDCGAQHLKGIEQPLQLYRVVRPSGMRGRFPAMAAIRGMTPFVGREDELRSLLHRWERVVEGDGQVVTIIGEAGIGKSRLVQRFRQELVATPHTWLECATAPFFQNTPFYAVADMLQQSFHWETSHTVEQRLAALEASLGLAGLDPDEAVPLIAPLLELPVGTRYPPLSMAPDQQRKRLLATVVAWALGAAKAQPLVIATEDLHWADPSTLELTQLLVEQGTPARLLLLYTARPEFQAPWPMRAHHTQINLNRLNAGNVRMMVAQVAAKIALSDETVATVVERTGGVPLFVEELTRAVLESGDAKLTGREIPATLHDSLMARLDRLGPAKEVLQVGAVIGSEFSNELLHAVHAIAEEELQRALRKLADAELLYVRGIAPDATYLFKHALIRDAAYEALLKSRRRELHRIVASTINERFPELKDAHPEMLARHWTEAGEVEPAIAEWSRAGQTAAARNAFKEAEQSYGEALTLLRMVPQSLERDRREQNLWQVLHGCFQVTRGFAAAETTNAIDRAASLAEGSSNLEQLVTSVSLRASTVLLSGDLVNGSRLAERALDLALREGSRNSLADVQVPVLLEHYWSGDFAAAERDFVTASTLYADPNIRQRVRPTLAWIAEFAYGSWNAWTLGHADLARKPHAEMMAAVDASRPYSVAMSGYYAAHLRLFMREDAQTEALAETALEFSLKHQFPYTAAASRCVLGHALAHLGRAREAVELIRDGIANLVESGADLLVGNFTTYLAAAQQRQGSVGEALETVEQALQANSDILAYRPEMFRLRGELRFELGQTEMAENDFREALALAQKTGAKAWELRTTMSLARLFSKQGRRDEARTMLAEIYDWFTEGFDTADLKDAKALLQELAI
jgi:class 3 adenylate cyclase/tetratricopeptide (TPR) repeat protein